MSSDIGLHREFGYRASWHQLIVIGNGFDLECGLKSGFASFMAARKAAFDAADDDNDAGPLHFRRTIWDVILDTLEDSDWCDVEGAISFWLTGGCVSGDVDNQSVSLMERTLGALAQASKEWAAEVDSSVGSVVYYLAGSPEEAAVWTREKLLKLTKADLGFFERDFSAYLHDELSRNDEYLDHAGRLVENLLSDSAVDEDEYNIDGSVLSFNYTRPCVSVDSFGRHVPWINIHGALDADAKGGGEIVFGIDGTGLLDDDGVMPFTKTYRILGLGSANDGKLVHVPPTVGNADYGTALVKFYGHSLSRADYSYFQSIFDSVRLYEGHTKLIFYYRRHSKGEISETDKAEELAKIRIDTMRQVIKLMSAYAKTLENKEHGRNLIHKLLIEGRLVVMELPCDASVQIVTG